MRIGHGYDLHRLVSGRNLYLGGVIIPADTGEDGHSDGDVLLHAIIDALLGSAALGDIGTFFPPTDPQYKDISSRLLLRKTDAILKEKGFSILNIDSTVVLEKPKILPFIDTIRAAIAEDLQIDIEMVSVKGKTKEKIGAVGKSLAVEAYAVALTEKR